MVNQRNGKGRFLPGHIPLKKSKHHDYTKEIKKLLRKKVKKET